MEWCLADVEDDAYNCLLKFRFQNHLQLMQFYGLLEAGFVFETLVSDMISIARQGIAPGTGRGSEDVCVFTRGGVPRQRCHCLELSLDLTNDLPFPSLLLRIRKSACQWLFGDFCGVKRTKPDISSHWSWSLACQFQAKRKEQSRTKGDLG